MEPNAKLIEAKKDELHFMEQVIRNMKHLEHMYMQGILRDDKALFGIRNAIAKWLYRAEKVEKFLNENEVDLWK